MTVSWTPAPLNRCRGACRLEADDEELPQNEIRAGLLHAAKDMDHFVEQTTRERARALSRGLFAQMAETVHLRRQGERHPSSEPDIQPRALKPTSETLPSADLNEMTLEAE